MSHEIRTPLNGIVGMIQLLRTTALDSEQSKCIQLAETATQRLTRLLSDILDLSRFEAGVFEIQETEFCLEDLCASLMDLFAIAAKNKDIVLECIPDPAAPSHLVGDEARVRQVLFNLVGNALKFTHSGCVRIHMTMLLPAKNGDVRMLFSVTDSGIGIPDDMLRKLFMPFVQIDGSLTRSFQGAGLGLAIVYRLVKRMRGNISMESTVGQGTSVHVVLPFALPETARASSNQNDPLSGRSLALDDMDDTETASK